VSNDDVRAAAHFVLPHRLPRRRSNERQEQDLQQKLDQLIPPDQEETDESEAPQSNDSTKIFQPAEALKVAKIETLARPSDVSGKRSSNAGVERGRIAAVTAGKGSNVAIEATIRHSITRTGGSLNVAAEDLHHKRREGKQGHLIILVVDASGSMAAMERMRQVKATVLALLQDAYQRRDKVAVISFRGDEAEVVVPPTRSSMLAQDRMSELPTGGSTPLAAALRATIELLGNPREELQPLLVLLTDAERMSPATLRPIHGGSPWFRP